MAAPAPTQWFTDLGTGFVKQYYQFFGSNRAQCAGIYRDNSLMTWSGEQMAGVASIMAKFAALPFTRAQFNPQEIQCQPIGGANNSVLVVVQGELFIEGERHNLAYNDVFHLTLDAAGQWYVANQMFRILGGSGSA